MTHTPRHTLGGRGGEGREEAEAHLFLVSNLVELLCGVVARFSNVAVRRGSDSSGLLETAVLKRTLQRVRLGAIQSEIEHQT
jgi:hypothetical protein